MGVALCSTNSRDEKYDFQLKEALRSLQNLKEINNKNIENPLNFRDAPMVTTFVRSAGSRTNQMLKMLERANVAELGVMLSD